MEFNAIYEGDNLEVMSKFDSKSIDLIYADPPFFTNKQFEIIWHDGAEKRAFEDRWKGGIEHYISWMEPRLETCHRLLKDTGSLFVHCDYHASAHLRVIILEMKLFGNVRLEGEKHNTRAINLEYVLISYYFSLNQIIQNLIRNLSPLMKLTQFTRTMSNLTLSLLTKTAENIEVLIFLALHHDTT